MSKYEIVIGMEVHAELLTHSKQFCACANTALAAPNTHVCPVCLGFPGSLPVLNAKSVDLSLRTVLAFESQINPSNFFERKNYFYPDLPKAYQTTQAMSPLGTGGFIEIDVVNADSSTRVKRVTLHDVHMEEDTGKSQHGESIGDPFSSLVDYNRAGIPLLEIVSNPDMRSVEEAEAYMTALRQLLLYLEVSDCKMEQGRLRFEASVSLRLPNAPLGTRVEVKNLNSMKSVRDSLKSEIARQERVLDAGETVQQMTMLWDEASGTTQPMRSKEQAHDYRYFPEPDLVPLSIDDAWLSRVQAEMPELPRARKTRFQEKLELSPYEAEVLTASRELADFYEAVLVGFDKPKTVSNWVSNELLGRLNNENKTVTDSPVSPEKLRELLQLLDAGTISGKTAKEVFDEMFASGRDAKTIVAEKGLTQMSDTSELEAICQRVLEANPKAVEDFKAGKERSFGSLVGGVMKETKGRANPSLVNDLLRQLLAK